LSILNNIIAIALITIGWSKHKKLMTSESKFKTFLFFYGLGLLLILSRIWKIWLRPKKSSRNRAFFIKVWFCLNRIELKVNNEKINNSPIFLFSIVALVSSQSQITTNQKTSIQQGTIQKVAVLKDTVKKTKVVVTQQEIKRDTVADKMVS
jgi:hypothetical protein